MVLIFIFEGSSKEKIARQIGVER